MGFLASGMGVVVGTGILGRLGNGLELATGDGNVGRGGSDGNVAFGFATGLGNGLELATGDGNVGRGGSDGNGAFGFTTGLGNGFGLTTGAGNVGRGGSDGNVAFGFATGLGTGGLGKLPERFFLVCWSGFACAVQIGPTPMMMANVQPVMRLSMMSFLRVCRLVVECQHVVTQASDSMDEMRTENSDRDRARNIEEKCQIGERTSQSHRRG